MCVFVCICIYLCRIACLCAYFCIVCICMPLCVFACARVYSCVFVCMCVYVDPSISAYFCVVVYFFADSQSFEDILGRSQTFKDIFKSIFQK